jgi:arsenate reductase-like glutaredoxin family protein
MELLRACETILVSKGKKLLRFSTQEGIEDEELAKVVLGRTGNLRAPAIIIDKICIVGFHAEGYEEIFG